jgi:hypothetical protein
MYNKLYITKIKDLCSTKDLKKKKKNQTIDGEKIFAKYVTFKRLASSMNNSSYSIIMTN